MSDSRAVRAAVALATAATWVGGTSCGGATSGAAGAGTSPPADASLAGDASDGGPAEGAACSGCDAPPGAQQSCVPGGPIECNGYVPCPDGGSASLSGVVYDPAGRNPMSTAYVYIPQVPGGLRTLTTGTSSCDECEVTIGAHVAVAMTDASGFFRISGVPTGNDVPLVIQAGKWRRSVTVPAVKDCTDTAVSAALTRLPRNQTEGDMPQMALVTGGCDNLACFLRSVGVDASEFSAPHGGGRVDVYQGVGGAALSGAAAGDCTTDACPLWSSKPSLEAYDEALLGCECAAHDETKPASAVQAMHDWLEEGGRVIATHSQMTWFANGPADFQGVASWTSGPSSGAAGPFAVAATTAGQALGQWLANVGAADGTGVVALDPADVSTSVTSVASPASAWIVDTATASEAGAFAGNVKLLSVPTRTHVPEAGPELVGYCGAAHLTDIHAGGGQALRDRGSDGAVAPASVPGACDGGPLTAEEKALEYLLFDQAVCIGEADPSPPSPDGAP